MKSSRNAFVHFAFYVKHTMLGEPVLLRDDLMRLRKCGPWLSGGICAHVTPCNMGYLKALFVNWPAGSGTRLHPVPADGLQGDRGNLGRNGDAFMDAWVSGTLWDKSTEYGRARWELLDWLIAEDQRLTEELLNGDKS